MKKVVDEIPVCASSSLPELSVHVYDVFDPLPCAPHPFPLVAHAKLPYFDRLAFYGCAAKATGDLLGGLTGVEKSLNTVCSSGQSADALVSLSVIQECLLESNSILDTGATAHFCQPMVDAWDCVYQASSKSPCFNIDTVSTCSSLSGAHFLSLARSLSLPCRPPQTRLADAASSRLPRRHPIGR